VPAALKRAKAALPQIETLLSLAADQWDEMQRLNDEYNLPD
jgi:hypothetical protein